MKFLYLTGSALESDDQEWQLNLKTEAKNYSNKLKVFTASYKDLLHICRDRNWEIIDLSNKRKLSAYDVIHFRNYTSLPNEVAVIASYLEARGVCYINNEVRNIRNTSSKLWQMKHLQAQSIPVPNTYFFHSSRYKKALDYLDQRYDNTDLFPCVVKLIDGMKGSHNYLAINETELSKIYQQNADKKFIMQPFIKNDGDYRILFIGSDSEPVIFKRTAIAGSHLNNTSKGGNALEVPEGEVSFAYVSMARQAAKSMDIEIAGVDLIIDSDSNKPYILEVNTTPAILTGFNTPKKTVKYLDYLLSLSKEAKS